MVRTALDAAWWWTAYAVLSVEFALLSGTAALVWLLLSGWA